MKPRVGILGVGGSVGASLLAQLGKVGAGGDCRFRLGARDPSRLEGRPGPSEHEWARVNLTVASELASFCAGCAIVLNCAGPAYTCSQPVARACLAAGAHFIDVAGEHLLAEEHSGLRAEFARHGLWAMVGCGMMPGATGILPRYLATLGYERIDSLSSYAGGLERFSRASAADFIAGFLRERGASHSALRDGRRVARALERTSELRLPFVDPDAVEHPYLSDELVRVARQLGIGRVDGYNVLAGARTRGLLGSLGSVLESRVTALDQGGMDQRTTQLIETSTTDLTGRKPYQVILLETRGVKPNAMPLGHRLVLYASDGYALTALTALAALQQGLRGGRWHGITEGAAAIAPSRYVELLRSFAREDAVVSAFTVTEFERSAPPWQQEDAL